MRGSDKKTRADNFSEEDKGLLLSLIADHVTVLECRKTDHKNNSAKYKAWAAISKNFHRQATHPRNFTQMKDLYRRLKLKAKKEVVLWHKACAESPTGKPLPSSQVVQPDDTSFWVYDLIKPYKEELNPDDDEHERLLAEAIKESSSNSPYTAQDLNANSSYSSCPQPAGEASSKTQSTESYRSLERRLERERERRTHGEGSNSRLDSKVLPEEASQQATDTRRNGFRLSANPKMTTRTAAAAAEPSTTCYGSYHTTSNRDALASMGSLTVASTPSSAALRGHSIGYGSRDVGVRSPTQRGRNRGGMPMPMTLNDKLKNTRYSFVDPVHSASPSFQQRVSELAALESDTIRYERTKRIKKRSKQENQ